MALGRTAGRLEWSGRRRRSQRGVGSSLNRSAAWSSFEAFHRRCSVQRIYRLSSPQPSTVERGVGSSLSISSACNLELQRECTGTDKCLSTLKFPPPSTRCFRQKFTPNSACMNELHRIVLANTVPCASVMDCPEVMEYIICVNSRISTWLHCALFLRTEVPTSVHSLLSLKVENAKLSCSFSCPPKSRSSRVLSSVHDDRVMLHLQTERQQRRSSLCLSQHTSVASSKSLEDAYSQWWVVVLVYSKLNILVSCPSLPIAQTPRLSICCGLLWNCCTNRTRKCGNEGCIAIGSRPTWCHCQGKIFLGFPIWAADKANAVSVRFAVGRHFNAA